MTLVYTEQKANSTESVSTKKGGVLLVPEDALRFNNLNFLRSLLAIIVLWSHCFIIYYGTEEEVEPLYLLTKGQMTLDVFAVNFFFVISGFLILLSWESMPNFGVFLKKRILRIYPAFIVVSLLCLFIFAPFGTGDYFRPFGYWIMYFETLEWNEIPKNILLLNAPQAPWVFRDLPISDALNTPLWTIRYEFICYLIIPVLAFFRLFKVKVLSFLLFIGFYGIYTYQLLTHKTLFDFRAFTEFVKPDLILQFLSYFFAGIVLYVYRKDFLRKRGFLYLSISIIIGSTFFLNGLAITLPIFGSYILFHIAFARSYSLIGFSKWGDFSYGIYLFAWPVQQLVLMYLEKYMDVTLLFILSTSVTIFFAYLSWNYVEKPCLELKKISFGRNKKLN